MDVSERQAVLAVQAKLQEMTAVELGSMLAECRRLQGDKDEFTRQVATNLRTQVLAEFTRRFGHDAHEVIQ